MSFIIRHFPSLLRKPVLCYLLIKKRHPTIVHQVREWKNLTVLKCRLHPECQLNVWVQQPVITVYQRAMRTLSVESLICCFNIYFTAVLCSLSQCDSEELRLVLLCLHSWEDLSHHQVHVRQLWQHLSGNMWVSRWTRGTCDILATLLRFS